MMELGLTLGDTARKPLKFLDESQNMITKDTSATTLGFCLGLDPLFSSNHRVGGERISGSSEEGESWTKEEIRRGSSDPTVQLDLLPFSPLPRTGTTKPSQLRFPWMQPPNLISEAGKGPDMNRQPSVVVVPDEDTEDGAALSSPNSTVSSFQMEYGIYRSGRSNNKRDFEGNNEGERIERASSRGSDEDENGLLARKKLRLTKDQSAFLEESFKEHNTLNPKQKLALAKQLNLRPRQVEVWFQNRRARTKLKQTEVDCEYLKRCCETLTEENRRLQKELQELRALKSSKPFYMQLPATTLTMCPSCERVGKV